MIDVMLARTGSLIASLAAAVHRAGRAGRRAGLSDATRSRFVVPFAAGGGNDILARLIAQHMGRALGQQLVIENRAGAGGTLGARAVAKAAPDGYTLMVGHSGVFGVAPALYADPGYAPSRDFAPIGLIASYQQVLVVHPSMTVRSVADLIALAKKDPGKITYATAGVGSGSHLSTELFTAMANIKLTHVPYRGTGAMQGEPGGRPCRHVDHDLSVRLRAAAQRRAAPRRGDGREALRHPARAADRRESGVPGTWRSFTTAWWRRPAPAAPSWRGSTPSCAPRWRAPTCASASTEEGGDALSGTPDQQAADIAEEEAKWGALVRKLGIRSE